MTPQEITEKYIKIAIRNGWDLKNWYNRIANNISDLPRIIIDEINDRIIKTVSFYIMRCGLEQLLFTDISFAKAVWKKNPKYSWQNRQQQLIIQEDWWIWLEENLLKGEQNEYYRSKK